MKILFYSFDELASRVLPYTSQEERLALTKVFDDKATSHLSNTDLADKICRNAGNGLANFFRGCGVSYNEVVQDTAKVLKLDDIASISEITANEMTLAEMDGRKLNSKVDREHAMRWSAPLDGFSIKTEKAILCKVATYIYSSMSSEKRRELDQKIQEVASKLPSKDLRSAGTAGALLAIGNLGGFATYTLMSTVITSISLGESGIRGLHVRILCVKRSTWPSRNYWRGRRGPL